MLLLIIILNWAKRDRIIEQFWIMNEPSEALIEISKVSVHQGKLMVLRDVTFSMNEGEFVYLIGKTGSGKSSLMKAMYGEVPIADGQAKVAGFDLSKLKRSELPLLRRQLGIVFQDFQLLPDRTIFDNMTFVLKATGWKDKRKMEYRIQEVLDAVGQKTKGFKFPHELSGGEQQRMVVARALLNHPKLILADEPTGNLDPETSKDIMELLRQIRASGTGVLMATHDHSFLKDYPERTLICANGYISEV